MNSIYRGLSSNTFPNSYFSNYFSKIFWLKRISYVTDKCNNNNYYIPGIFPQRTPELQPRAKPVETHRKNTDFFPVILAKIETTAK